MQRSKTLVKHFDPYYKNHSESSEVLTYLKTKTL